MRGNDRDRVDGDRRVRHAQIAHPRRVVARYSRVAADRRAEHSHGRRDLVWYLIAPLPFHLYGTLALLVIGFVTIGIPYGMRYASAGLGQIRDELEEAAAVSGAGWAERFMRIYVPLLAPSLLAGFLTTVIIAFREISAAIFLYSQGSEVVSIAIYDLWSNGQYPAIAALGCVLVALLLGLVTIVQRLGGRIGVASAE